MRKWILPVLLVVLAFVVYRQFFKKDRQETGTVSSPKSQPVTVSKYSDSLVNAMNGALEGYYKLSESFVNWDSAAVITNGKELGGKLGTLNFDELKKDTTIYETAVSYLDGFRPELETITGNASMENKRRSFHTLSQNLYDLLRTIRYDGSKIYFQECPMAFNDTESANWLSKTNEIRNPYLGLHHPRYKSGMISCGETRDSLHFSGQSK